MFNQGLSMRPARNRASADPQEHIAELKRELAEVRRELHERTSERDEGLAREATAEVLGVINSSPGDLAVVFDAILEKAMRLCDAAFGHLRTFDGERFQPAASRGVPAALAEYYRGPRLPVF